MYDIIRKSGFPSNTQHLLDLCPFPKHALIKLPTINKCIIFDGNASITMYYSPPSRTQLIAGHKQGTAVEIPLALIPE